MATGCCQCPGAQHAAGAGSRANLPLICLVPRDDARGAKQLSSSGKPGATSASAGRPQSDFHLLDEDYIKSHFNLPKRALYLDPFRRPLITFPMTQENVQHFNLARKYKVNQQILDGYLDGSEALTAPSVFPYESSTTKTGKAADTEEEIIYILQLPDWEYNCPIHNQTVRTPRFIWHACKKGKGKEDNQPKRGGGVLNKPKPWLLSRHTDFDLLSQCPLVQPGFEALGMSAPFIVQMNPEGRWENRKPENMDEGRLKAIIQHLAKSNAISAAQSYCCQCAAEDHLPKTTPQYIPVVMMPIYSADDCPFDMDCEVQKIKAAEQTRVRPSKKKQMETKGGEEKDDDKKKLKKRGYQMQRLTDFDLLSQW